MEANNDERKDMETRVERDRYGKLSANTVVPLGVDRRELRIETYKTCNGRVKCNANVVTVEEHGYSHRMSFAGDRSGDYSKVLAVEAVRATEKNLRAVHAAGMEKFDAVMAEVRDWYGIKEAA